VNVFAAFILELFTVAYLQFLQLLCLPFA